MTSHTPQPASPIGSAIVLGGGLAGIAAALRLAEHGVATTLIEAGSQLGGRATSFTDPATGETVDNSHHAMWRCYTNHIDLLRRLGVEDRIEWQRRLHFIDARGRCDTLAGDGMPAPLHLARPFLAMQTLTWREKLAISRAMLGILQLGEDRRELGNMSFREWLQEMEQPEGAVEKFWTVVILSACNETIDRASACYALQVFQEGFLASDDGYEMGLPGGPLAELYSPAAAAIERAGGRVRLGVSAEKFEFDGSRVVGVITQDHEKLVADAYVSAIPFDRVARMCSDLMFASDDRLRCLDELRVSPLVGVHLTLRRADGEPAMRVPHAALMQSPLQWAFCRGHTREGGTRVHGVIGAAHEWVDKPADQIVTMAAYEVRRHLPEAVDAELVRARVVKEKRAMFSVRPGVDRIRPETRGDIANLFLAGDWCDTGWPPTMEGAVRSGYRAAAAALDALRPAGAPHALQSPDAGATRLYRFLSG